MHIWKICKLSVEMDGKQLVLTKMNHILKERQKVIFPILSQNDMD